MGFQKSQLAEATKVSLAASTGPLVNMAESSTARKKKQARKIPVHLEAGSTSSTCEPWPVRGDMEMELSTKPERGRTAPVGAALSYSDAHHHGFCRL